MPRQHDYSYQPYIDWSRLLSSEPIVWMEPQLYIFDKDGTIIKSINGRPANLISEQELLPSVAEGIAKIKAQGKKIGIASNQGGVAWGFITYAQARALIDHAALLIDADYTAFCPHDARGQLPQYAIECECRKPKAGMLTRIADEAGIEPAACIFVGDWETDKEAAKAAGMRFVWAHEFFGWGKTERV